MIVVFDSCGADDTQGIFARRFDKFDNPIGNQFCVDVASLGNQRYPSAAIGAGGESMIAWSGQASATTTAASTWAIR